MKIAVVGCLHGKLDEIYVRINEFEQHEQGKIDLVLVCGDFQAVRGLNDLKCMAVPDKYKELGDFHQYYLGKKHASHLTLVVGGNHEASNYFQQLPYGGWIAPNIYYLGYSNVLKFNGLRIGGISGIFNRHSINRGHFEHLPYTPNSMRSAYHTRYLEVFRMLQVKEKLDLMLTHDWPLHIYKMPGAKEFLIRRKPHFRNDINNHALGSPMHETVLIRLKPRHWFAAHLHVRFETNYVHQSYQSKFDNTTRPTNESSSLNGSVNETLTSTDEPQSTNTDESKLTNTDESKLTNTDEPKSTNTNEQQSTSTNEQALDQPKTTVDQKDATFNNKPEVTHFLALDKCLPKRRYLEIMDIECEESTTGLEYDLEWLAILKSTDQYLSTQEYPVNHPPQPHIFVQFDLDEHKQRIREAFNNDLRVPENFATSLPYNSAGEDSDPNRQVNHINEQTTRLCRLLEITDPIQSLIDRLGGRTNNPDKISISDDEDSMDEKDKANDEANENTVTDEPNSKRFKEDEQLFFIDKSGSKI